MRKTAHRMAPLVAIAILALLPHPLARGSATTNGLPAFHWSNLEGARCLLDIVVQDMSRDSLVATVNLHSTEGALLLQSEVEIRHNVARIHGTAGPVSFRSTVEILDDGHVAVQRTWGAFYLAETIFTTDSIPYRTIPTGGDEDPFSVGPGWLPEGWRLELLAETITSVDKDEPLLAIAAAPLVAGHALHLLGKSPIGDWLDCLEDTCERCGACWRGSRCEYCSDRDPFWARRFMGACYDGGAVLCMIRTFGKLIASIFPDGDGPTM